MRGCHRGRARLPLFGGRRAESIHNGRGTLCSCRTRTSRATWLIAVRLSCLPNAPRRVATVGTAQQAVTSFARAVGAKSRGITLAAGTSGGNDTRTILAMAVPPKAASGVFRADWPQRGSPRCRCKPPRHAAIVCPPRPHHLPTSISVKTPLFAPSPGCARCASGRKPSSPEPRRPCGQASVIP